MKIKKLALSTAIASALSVGVAQAQEPCDCAHDMENDRTMSMNDTAAAGAAGVTAAAGAMSMDDGDTKASGAAENIATPVDYDELYAKGISVEEFLDAEVLDEEGDSMGEVEDLIIGAGDNRITGMVIETGGFLDIGDSHLLYPFDKAKINGSDEVKVGNIDGEHVEELSLYKDIEGDSVGDRWRVTDMIGGLAYTNGEPYGRVDDVIIDKSGNIMAVVVQPDVMYDDYSYYAWPYVGYDSDEGIYDVPMDQRHAFGMQSFDRDEMQAQSD